MTTRTVHDSGAQRVSLSGRPWPEIDIRRFTKRGDAMDVGDLTLVQHRAYERFLQLDKSTEERDPSLGLEALLHEIFPIESYDGTMFLDYNSYELDEPR